MRLLLIGGLLLLLALWPPVAILALETRIIAADDSQLIIEVTFESPEITDLLVGDRTYLQVRSPSLAGPTRPGLPDLPLAELLIALPPGNEAIVSILEDSLLPLGEGIPLPVPLELFDDIEPPRRTLRFDVDPAIYDGADNYPSPAVNALPGRSWRQLRVAPIQVAPVMFDPVSKRLFSRTRLRLLVRFVPVAATLIDPAPAAGGASVAENPRWEPLYKSRIINSRQAADYKRRAVTSAVTQPLKSPREGRPFQPRTKACEFSIQINQTAMYRLPYERISMPEFSSRDLAWGELSLWVRDYDETPALAQIEWPIHFLADDADSSGTFGPGDGLIFYGEDAWDFFSLSPAAKRYGQANIYWLEIGDSEAGAMATIAAWLDQSGLPDLTTYVDTIHFEENRFYGGDMVSDDTYSPYSGPFAIHTDHYNWTDYDPNTGEAIKLAQIDMPYLTAVNEIKVRLQGQESMGGIYHQGRLWFSRTDGTVLGELAPSDTAWAFPGNPFRLINYRASTITLTEELPGASEFSSGRNYLKLYLSWVDDGLDNVKGGGIGVDWIDVTFTGKFQLLNHQLSATISGTGIKQPLISRLTTKEILAFDLTDSRQPRRLELADSLFSASGSRWNLSVQLDLGDDQTEQRLFLIEPAYLSTPAPGAVKFNREANLDRFDGEDLVAIFPRRFAETAQPLLQWRETQGHHVLQATTEAIYNTYTGGRPHPFAIKRFLRRMWRESSPLPDYLLLIGDASVDLAGQAGVGDGGWADSSYVPTITIPGFSGSKELVASDHWFIDNLAGEWDESMTGFADLFLGRISCGTETELATYIDKLLTYEQTDLDADWRQRIFIHSDDGFSSSLSGLGDDQSYMHYSIENLFETISRQSIDYIRQEPFFNHFTVETLFQSDMDTIPELGRCVIDNEDPSRCQRDDDGEVVLTDGHIAYLPNLIYGQDDYKAFLIEQLSRGGLIWAYQGHSNKKLLTHEYVFQHANSRTRDVFQLANLNKPFLFIGAGCHLAEFAHPREAQPLIGGDSMAEVMLFCCPGEPKGAIAAYGSTDFEAIGHRMEQYFFRAMFAVPPASAGGEALAPRWRPGELMTAAKLQCSVSDRQRLTYSLLGDPALRLSFTPPTAQIAFNDLVWTPAAGNLLRSQRDDDSLAVTISLQDDSHLPLPQVSDYDGAVPGETVVIVSDEAGGRSRSFVYQTQIQRRPYSFTIETADGDGHSETYTWQVPCEIQLYERRGAVQFPLGDDAVIAPAADLRLTVRLAARMTAADLTLYLDDTAIEKTSAELTAEPDEPFVWTFDYSITAPPDLELLPVAVAIRQHDGSEPVLIEQTLLVGTPEVRFNHVWWIPSPFSERTTLVYELSQRAARIRLRLFSTTGRCLLESDSDEMDGNLYPPLPLSAGVVETGAPIWNGRDQDGDEVANGVYFYELTAWDQDGKLADQVIDKLVRFRGD